MRNAGEICVMTMSSQFTYWHVFKFENVNQDILYDQIISQFIDKIPCNKKYNLSHHKTTAYLLHENDISQKKLITETHIPCQMNSEILIKIDLGTRIKRSPTLNENEAMSCFQKAQLVSCYSIRASLKFFKSASNFYLYEYVDMLCKMKKWRRIHMLSDRLRETFPKDPKINLIVAKCFEAYNDTDKAFQIYKETLQFSNSPKILIECSKLYSKSDPYVSALLLNHTLHDDSTNPDVIIQSMISLIADKKYDDVIDIAFRHKKSIKFLAISFKKNDSLSNRFIEVFRNIKATLEESINLAMQLYNCGAVLEALHVCQCTFDNNPSDPYITRVYYTILLNEGLYKTYAKVSVMFSLMMHDDVDVEFLYGPTFFSDYVTVVECRSKPSVFHIKKSYEPSPSYSHKQNAIFDCVCSMQIFLYLIGSCADISTQTSSSQIKLLVTEPQFPFWQNRQYLQFIKFITDQLVCIDTADPSAFLIGDGDIFLAAYSTLTFNNKPYYLLPNLISDISLWKLRKGHRCGHKESFWARIETADEYDIMMIELGSVDCEYEIQRLIRKNIFSSIQDALKEITNIYYHVVSKIQVRFPKMTILVHPVIPKFPESVEIAYEFNSHVRSKFFDNQIKFLDLFPLRSQSDLMIGVGTAAQYTAALKKWLTI